ncbi:MAG: PrsW family intramembrane metalloprotease [Bacteroidota bacterium]
MSIVRLGVGILPVLLFLLVLNFSDTYKLVRFRRVGYSLLWGIIGAIVAYFINSFLFQTLQFETGQYTRYISPFIEEMIKALPVYIMIRRHQIGFLLEGAIIGFCIGAGFGCVENIYYWNALPDADIFLIVIRGLGTAVMHAGATALFTLITAYGMERASRMSVMLFIPGLVIAIAIHSLYNHFLLSPPLTTIVFLIALPAILIIALIESERSMKGWLGVRLDSELALLDLVTDGKSSDTRAAKYYNLLHERLDSGMIRDVTEYMKLHIELSLNAKGVLMIREAGITLPPDEKIIDKLKRLKELDAIIGSAGKRALAPLLRFTMRDLWQLYMLENMN